MTDAASHPGLRLADDEHVTKEAEDEIIFGFWIFLMSDAIVFGLLFATYATMVHATAGAPGPKDVFDIKSVFIETLALLSSSFTYGMASLSMKYDKTPGPLCAWLLLTLALGLSFIGLEIHDFIAMIAKGAVPEASGFASAFFGLTPLHGLHVLAGCVWMIVLMIQIVLFGVNKNVKLGILRLGLFWHFLDIVWVGIFTIVYLGGLS